MNSYEVHTICTDRALECCPTAVTFETVVAFKTCAIVETGVTFTFANATWTYTYKNNHLMDSHLTLWYQLPYTKFVHATIYIYIYVCNREELINTPNLTHNELFKTVKQGLCKIIWASLPLAHHTTCESPSKHRHYQLFLFWENGNKLI